MSNIEETVKNLPPKEKAAIFQLLAEDGDLKQYMLSEEKLLEELEQRDRLYEEGTIKLLTRNEVAEKMKSGGTLLF